MSFLTKVRKTKTADCWDFEAERVIARRKDRKGCIKYLVKWKGYSSFENTWEPEEHLSPASLRYFANPHPAPTIVEECLDRLRAMVMVALKHEWSEQKITLEFSHDVYNFLLGGKGKPAEKRGWTMYEEQDFSNCKFPANWNCIYDQHGDGSTMKFSIKMRAFLGRTPRSFGKQGDRIVELPRAYTEKISINFIKISSNCS
ncbi:Hypothetical predicted protein [Paramuricea clavata]|uniref:Uncharacterized protein n=1 Tax=Paramuricea clavata TaxID=317549 RepID=A0A7D9LYJ6_PARCT|nr:Hypothetical predicted protein [Paramuricea clavata]